MKRQTGASECPPPRYWHYAIRAMTARSAAILLRHNANCCKKGARKVAFPSVDVHNTGLFESASSCWRQGRECSGDASESISCPRS